MKIKNYSTTLRRILLTSTLLILLCIWSNQTMAVIGFSAIIVALFKDNIYTFYLPPKLELIISENPECFHEVDARDIRTGQIIEKQFWLGAIITNSGVGIAENIELFFDGLDSNIVTGFSNYKSIPLIRSWVGKPAIRALPPGFSIRFDICFFKEKSPHEFNFHLISTPNALHRITCKYNEESFFDFEIKALSDNTKSIKKRVKINFFGNYTKNLKIKC